MKNIIKNLTITEILFIGNVIFGLIAITCWIVAIVLNKQMLWTWTFNIIQFSFLFAQYKYNQKLKNSKK